MGGDGSIIPAISYSPQKRSARNEFMPWHRPRKQFVRREQWLQEALWTLSSRDGHDGAPLRYLGLPGADLLDIRYLHKELCVPHSRPLRFLGFDESARPNSKAQGALNLSLSEVMRLAHVLETSEVRPEDFRILADTDSVAWDHATRLGPYDLINIDLCDDIRRDEPLVDQSMYQAISQLFGLQRRCHTSWSLLLTTKTDGGSVSADAWERLLGHVERTLRDCPQLVPAAEAAFGGWPDDLRRAGEGQAPFALSALSISLWVAALAAQVGCQVSLSSAIGYAVGGTSQEIDMVSLAFRFSPRLEAVDDVVGLARPVDPSEDARCVDVAAMPAKISAVVDADRELANRELFSVLVDEMAQLLHEARYDTAKYRVWADEFGGPPPARAAVIADGASTRP